MTAAGDAAYERLVRARFDAHLAANPVLATALGVHDHDERLGSRTRESMERRIAAARQFVTDLEALDPAALGEAAAFEREIALLGARRLVFDHEVQRQWEQRASAIDDVGDGIFILFARDFAPLEQRLEAITARVEDTPRLLAEAPQLLGRHPVRMWNELELESAAEIGGLLDEVEAAGRGAWGEQDGRQARLERASRAARAAIEGYRAWLAGRLDGSDESVALGRERYDELVGLRAFDGLGSDDILEIGWQQLADLKSARRAVAHQIDPEASEAEVLDRVKSDHAADFEAALEGYRDAMFRARAHIAERGLATIPRGESLRVIATPQYLRNSLPFAAYFEAPPFDDHPSGIYVVTPSVDGDGRAMREHNRSSIINTSIHEAYPGHHLQLSCATTHPSLARLMLDAPEFVEGWGMYSEQMMREEGFETSPACMFALYTDAIWRACRIILDVRLHRGELTVAQATDFLVEHTGFERPHALAEVKRYTLTPTQPLSYLLGKVMLLRLRDDERRRLGADFSLRAFHDALLYGGSIPISFHRRQLAGEGGGPVGPRPLRGASSDPA
ncbi:MAG TPA: DUF885 domain-containing protein [Candidatus Sulfotelmatobacter sp.]|nr:DUF885 domain-containing protein [Candidatus Sulfotelmatobacter sp.]